MSRGSPSERVDARYLPGFGHDRLGDVDLTIEHVARNLEVHRSRGAVERLAHRHRDHVGDALGARHRGRELGDGRHHVDVRQILQRAHLVLRESALAADVQHRALGAECRGDAGHGVGEPGTCGRDDAAELAGLARVTVGRMRRDLLVTHVDDADALIDAAVVDVDDVAAAQA